MPCRQPARSQQLKACNLPRGITLEHDASQWLIRDEEGILAQASERQGRAAVTPQLQLVARDGDCRSCVRTGVFANRYRRLWGAGGAQRLERPLHIDCTGAA